MYHLSQKLDSLQECIKKGEKCRILYDILLSEIGMTYEDQGHDVWKKLGQVQDEYYESIKMLQAIMESGKREESVIDNGVNGEWTPDYQKTTENEKN